MRVIIRLENGDEAETEISDKAIEVLASTVGDIAEFMADTLKKCFEIAIQEYNSLQEDMLSEWKPDTGSAN